MNYDSLIVWLTNLIKNWGFWGLFFASALEEIIVPIPSSVVLITAGAILLTNYEKFNHYFLLDFTFLSFVGALGGTLGAMVPFLIFYIGGKSSIDKFGKYFGLSWDSIENFKHKLNSTRSDELTIFILRTLPIIPSILIAGTCGVIRINPLKFMLLFLGGGFFRCGILIFLGWQLGLAYLTHIKNIEEISNYITKIAFTILSVYIVWILVKRKYNL